MILHIAELEKFMPPFVEFIKENFNEEEHQFWFTGCTETYPVNTGNTVYVCRNTILGGILGYAKLIIQLHNANKILLHGLYNVKVIMVLMLCPWVLPKCYWAIWGSDLYQYTDATKALWSRSKEVMRHFVIKRVGHLVTYIEGDVELARQWYGAGGAYHECLLYLSNVVDPSAATLTDKNSKEGGVRILLGNSASPSNNHIEALERLLPYRDQDIKIFVPLSYGNQIHAKKVVKQGSEWFGAKFVPLTDFMPFDQYLDFLKNLDIVVFNHQRQQAMGNTITLLGMGKTVFMQNGTNHSWFLNDLGITLRDVAHLTLQPLDSEVAEKNSRIIKSYFSKKNLTHQLAKIFES